MEAQSIKVLVVIINDKFRVLDLLFEFIEFLLTLADCAVFSARDIVKVQRYRIHLVTAPDLERLTGDDALEGVLKL